MSRRWPETLTREQFINALEQYTDWLLDEDEDIRALDSRVAATEWVDHMDAIQPCRPSEEGTVRASGIAMERWVYRFRTVTDAAHFHELMEFQGEPSEWVEREVRTPLAPHAAFPLWHEVCRQGGYDDYVSADKVST